MSWRATVVAGYVATRPDEITLKVGCLPTLHLCVHPGLPALQVRGLSHDDVAACCVSDVRSSSFFATSARLDGDSNIKLISSSRLAPTADGLVLVDVVCAAPFVQVGEVISVVEESVDGWIDVRVGQRNGWYPKDYVKKQLAPPLEADSDSPTTSKPPPQYPTGVGGVPSAHSAHRQSDTLPKTNPFRHPSTRVAVGSRGGGGGGVGGGRGSALDGAASVSAPPTYLAGSDRFARRATADAGTSRMALSRGSAASTASTASSASASTNPFTKKPAAPPSSTSSPRSAEAHTVGAAKGASQSMGTRVNPMTGHDYRVGSTPSTGTGHGAAQRPRPRAATLEPTTKGRRQHTRSQHHPNPPSRMPAPASSVATNQSAPLPAATLATQFESAKALLHSFDDGERLPDKVVPRPASRVEINDEAYNLGTHRATPSESPDSGAAPSLSAQPSGADIQPSPQADEGAGPVTYSKSEEMLVGDALPSLLMALPGMNSPDMRGHGELLETGVMLHRTNPKEKGKLRHIFLFENALIVSKFKGKVCACLHAPPTSSHLCK